MAEKNENFWTIMIQFNGSYRFVLNLATIFLTSRCFWASVYSFAKKKKNINDCAVAEKIESDFASPAMIFATLLFRVEKRDILKLY